MTLSHRRHGQSVAAGRGPAFVALMRQKKSFSRLDAQNSCRIRPSRAAYTPPTTRDDVMLWKALRLMQHQWFGFLALVLVVGGTVSAKTGDPLKLGFFNTEDKATILKNTGNGPALRLRVA